ncbi:hypothetical protein [Edaphobacter modestus]|uniref:Uncharacterized protein n=1 Tax=Edaphobacter modestus TaxID=388466 RepID=A0A4Q7YSD3_9BACT|nr:hypothetical protein [Edaphobacter modestus]RZU39881.1 hypothetical protein BDD14_1276 [Edaphobacter modestus]
MHRRKALLLFASGAVGRKSFGQVSSIPEGRPSDAHITWVTESLKRMMTIKPGMTRKTLLTVFTTEGGISTRYWRTFVSQDCAYFKVDIKFRIPNQTEQDAHGHATTEEDDNDIIASISRPYLEFSVTD